MGPGGKRNGPCRSFFEMGGRRGTPGFRRPSDRAACRRSLGERRLANRDQQVLAYLRGKHIVLFMQPGKLGFEIAYSLLQAAHL
jgi:hypothetical protein